MNDTRARFEEIWPVPEGVYWSPLSRNDGWYWTIRDELKKEAELLSARLETFTRCQETTDVCVSLVDEMVKDLESYCENYYDLASVIRAKQIMEQKK